MQIQKLLTVVLSTLTIIPIYFLCRKFFNNKLSLVGAIIFAVEPRIILNSSLGITEPLYILLGTIVLVFFLSDNKKLIYSAFAVSAFVSMIRTEGIFLFFAISIMFMIRFRKEKTIIPKYFLVLTIFVLILLPMANYRTETMGHDGLTQKIINGINGHILGSNEFSEQDLTKIGENTQKSFFIRGGENFVKYLGWDLIPIFIFFVPIGVFSLFKKLDFKKGTIISCMISLSIPAFYAYSIPLEDTRYFFFLYPLFCVISLFTINNFQNYFKNQNRVLVLIIIGIIFSSMIFLHFKSIDYEHEQDAFQISEILIKSEMTINAYSPESQYLEALNILNDFSKFESYFSKEREKGISVRDTIIQKVTTVSPNEYSLLIEFIKDNQENGLTHIVADDKNNRLPYLKDVFENESNYEYLIKEFDSSEEGFSYHLKLFKIDYDKLNKSQIT
jgi:4-amino-4-deoxy-L-arabinose transferase-like glycosyltransferase